MCSKCVMDSTDTQIKFDRHGVCNHCREYDYKIKRSTLSPEMLSRELESIVEEIKRNGSGKEYDCIIGLSGGVDSSYLAYVVKKKLNLRPLAVHLDNGWDSKLAVKNIHNIVSKLAIDLHTHVIDWEEFRDLQLSYFKASVINMEVPSDHAIIAVLYKIAEEHHIKYILFGHNQATEQTMPRSWTFNTNDLVNLHAIHRKFGTRELKTFPQMGLKKYKYYSNVKKIIPFYPLNYVRYIKKEAIEIIENELGWKNYGGKHGESVFTKFYQGYILPVKFHVDKRKAHLSTLINSGQITREDALRELEKKVYQEEELKQDYEYVIKKFGLTREQFEELMHLPGKSHFAYPTDRWSKIYRQFYHPYIYPYVLNNPVLFAWLNKQAEKIEKLI